MEKRDARRGTKRLVSPVKSESDCRHRSGPPFTTLAASASLRWAFDAFFDGRDFLSGGNCLYLNAGMLRLVTALAALFSVLSAPLASAVCRSCCNQLVEHQATLCHDRAQAQLGHGGHMHPVRMVIDDSQAGPVVDRCDPQRHDRRLSCQSAACVRAGRVPVSPASAVRHQLRISAHLLAATIRSSLPITSPARPPDMCRVAVESGPSQARPLRI